MPNRLREFRERAGLTQSQLAAQIGCQWQHVSRMERGGKDGRQLSQKWAVKIAPLVGATWSQLMEEPPPPSGMAEGGADSFSAPAGPPPEYDRLPDQARALTAALKEREITLPAHAVTRHAQAALEQASRMDRRLSFEERARLAAEAKAVDIDNSL